MKLFIYPDPLDATCLLHSDSGVVIQSYRDNIHGRDGHYFDIPDSVPSGWGARLEISKSGYFTLEQRGVLTSVGDAWVFLSDDFKLIKVPPTPIPVPVPIPTPAPTYPTDPLGIINLIYKVGRFDLARKEECGKFTEACCEALHKNHSTGWGHIRKFGAQNQFNGHAVDAIQLLGDTTDTRQGIYDLIFDSESPDAKPQFIRKGDSDFSLWYYPA